MPNDDLLQHSDVILKPDPARTVVRPFTPDYPQPFAADRMPRAQAIVERILSLEGAALHRELAETVETLDTRHRDVDALLLRRFNDVCADIDADGIDDERKRLIGAYFSQEFSFESAALFNPSAVPHPDQSGVAAGDLRFVLSLRGIGEGHVSSVTFCTGTWRADGKVELDQTSDVAVPPIVTPAGADGIARLDCGGSREISETVLFPTLPSQRQGIEDLRLCHFVEDDGAATYYGTYTAFDGLHARSELLGTADFRDFTMRALSGPMAEAKGMALFPRRIGGKYAMLGRQDSENIWLQMSDDLCRWDNGRKVVAPSHSWEFVQIGNCGAPIELDEGWLVITHGVGTVRNYCLGAVLLDRDDPTKLIARTPQPILEPSPHERDGYVPNVVYSCGSLARGRELMLPYGIADSFTGFATCSIDDLLAAMEPA